MKLKFEPDLDFQLEAVEAVCDLFRGQEICQTEFTVSRNITARFKFAENDLGIGNRLTLLDDEILENLKKIQLRNALRPSEVLNSGDFTVEMETGTGKTYVYLRTIFELNKRYGFTKFVIVVPSVAIKEGVYKSLQITEDHFRAFYSGAPFEYFLYESAKFGQVRNFATSPQIQIMIMTVGAINKRNVNNLYKESEKTGGEKPIDLIKATRPILIVDEPQSVDGGLSGRGKEALGAMNPLCTLRYSATHANKHHMVYRLDAVDAYELKLVKQIEVASATVQDAHNKPFIRVVSIRNRRGVIFANVELDVEVTTGRVRRQHISVQDGSDLEQITGRAVYRDFYIGEICVEKGNEFVELRIPGSERFLRPGEVWGDVDAGSVHRQMIRRTIREHFDKEKRLHSLGIKVLSLFFVDVVNLYRSYDEAGNSVKGDYALMFEEEYRRLVSHPDYCDLLQEVNLAVAAENVHNGYFSIDKKGNWTDTAENNQTNRDNAERAYNLIMKEKEKLLSFETPLKFIFSHSALREGWDNPNVFQICALRDIKTERQRRQTIGRGLRLCVNQEGERLRGFEVNTLTVIAMERYEEFAENLQREIEEETGIQFGIVEVHQFAVIPIGEEGQNETLGFAQARVLFEYLKAKGYIDVNGRIQDSLRKALINDNLVVPEKFAEHRGKIVSVLQKLVRPYNIKDADERRSVRPRQAVLNSTEFKELWDRIKHKTTYRVTFDNENLLKICAEAIRKAPAIPNSRLQWRKANIAIGQSGVVAAETTGSAAVSLPEFDIELPDLLTELQDRTQLTRRSIQRILSGSERLADFRRNPQQFIEIAAQTINRYKRHVLVDGIKYQRLGEHSYHKQELFLKEELIGYMKNMRDASKSVYEKVIYESRTEACFADQLENHIAVKVYAKLPGWFTVPTPLGSYNPDWAVLINSEDGERLYFVVETKASAFLGDLRGIEIDKIECGKAHFRALRTREAPARFQVATSIDDLISDVDNG